MRLYIPHVYFLVPWTSSTPYLIPCVNTLLQREAAGTQDRGGIGILSLLELLVEQRHAAVRDNFVVLWQVAIRLFGCSGSDILSLSPAKSRIVLHRCFQQIGRYYIELS